GLGQGWVLLVPGAQVPQEGGDVLLQHLLGRANPLAGEEVQVAVGVAPVGPQRVLAAAALDPQVVQPAVDGTAQSGAGGRGRRGGPAHGCTVATSGWSSGVFSRAARSSTTTNQMKSTSPTRASATATGPSSPAPAPPSASWRPTARINPPP